MNVPLTKIVRRLGATWVVKITVNVGEHEGEDHSGETLLQNKYFTCFCWVIDWRRLSSSASVFCF